MAVNDILCALSNIDDFNCFITEDATESNLFEGYYSDIPTDLLDSQIKSFTVGYEDIIFYI